MPRKEAGQRGQDQRARQAAGYIDAKQPAYGAAGVAVRSLQFGQDGETAVMIGFALDRGRDATRGTLEQASAQATRGRRRLRLRPAAWGLSDPA